MGIGLSEPRLSRSAGITRRRLLPAPGEVLVRQGDTVQPQQAVVERRVPGEMFTVDVASLLGVSAQEARRHVVVSEGQHVATGDTLAYRDEPLKHVEVSAPATSIVSAYVGGRLFLKADDRLERLTAGIPGTALQVIADRGVVVGCSGVVVSGIWGLGPDAEGPLLVTERVPAGVFGWQQVSRKDGGTILAGDSVADARVLRRARQFGVQGLLVSSLMPGLVPLAVELGLSILVTEGSGSASLPEAVRDLLAEFAGRDVFLFPSGADAQHGPEAIIPAEEAVSATGGASGEDEHNLGPLVRITRPPYFGVVGRLIAPLGPDADRRQTAEVRLPDGRRARVPLVNLELLRD